MILVIGASGLVGSEVVKCLANSGAAYRVTSRRQGTMDVYLDFENPETFHQALSGVQKLFFVRPPELADAKRYFKPLIEAAVANNVQHIVFLSLLGAEKNPIVPHSKIEKLIIASKIPYTFLRPSFFMQNLYTQHGKELKEDREIFVPAGHGRTSFIDVRDIAEIAAKVLTQSGHENKGYSLTGSEALSYDEVARIISEETGVPVRYSNPSVRKFRARMKKSGIPSTFITVMIGIYFTAKIGLAKKVTPDLEQLLGRKPLTVRQFVRDYRHKLI
ncbi:SDR family oxidoreductase [Paenibacillus sp. FSL E2-0201]|uniref:SDR family oxidoreductase n=1 Tax=Paenibacillus sp. FSL E2-0201 TaxID=2954726 RepID=UPI0030DBE01C